MEINFLIQSSNIGINPGQTASQAVTTLTDPVFWVTLLGILIILVIVVLVSLKLWHTFLGNIKEASIEKKSLSAVIFEVRAPRHNEIEIQAADQMFSGLISVSEELKGLSKSTKARSFVSLEIVGLPESIRFYVVCSKNLAGTVEKSINGAYPNAEVAYSEEYNLFTDSYAVEFASLKLKTDNYKPIRTYEELPTDSLAPLLTTMSKISMGEAAAVQMVITSAGSDWRNQGKSYVEKIRSAMMDPEKKSKPRVSEDILAGIEKKCEKSGFYVDIRLVSVAKEKDNAKSFLDTMINTFSQFQKEGGNQFDSVKFNSNDKLKFIKDFVYRTPREKMVLNTAELATIYHFPNKKVETPHINWLYSKRAPATGGVPSSGDLWLGVNIYRDIKKPVFINRDDRRRHMYIIGKTGSGKSYFLQQMALQDIQNGEGVAYLDPHGDSAEWLLERIPPHRMEDVIYWNPGDTDRPFGFNIIEFYNEQDKHRVVNSFVGLMHKMYDPHNQGITGPRFERAVRNAMLTVMEDPDATLVEVLRILSDQKYASRKVPFIKDDIVRRFWTDEIANTQEFHKSEVLGYIVSKFDRFVTNKLTRNIFGQSRSGFNIRWIMDNRKILIVNLSKGLLGEENAQFLGLLLVPKILSAAMSRADMPYEQRRDFYLYVDEFQNFSTNDFAQILSESRKYRLNLIVANQYIQQIDEKIRDAVFGNVGTVASFKVGTTDAQFLETIYTPVFDNNDLVNLENTNAYIKMISQGESPPAFSLYTHYRFAPFAIPDQGNLKVAEIVKNLSRFRYGRDKSLVEAEIRKRAELEEGAGQDSGKLDALSGGFGGGAGLGGGFGQGGFGGSGSYSAPLKPPGSN